MAQAFPPPPDFYKLYAPPPDASSGQAALTPPPAPPPPLTGEYTVFGSGHSTLQTEAPFEQSKLYADGGDVDLREELRRLNGEVLTRFIALTENLAGMLLIASTRPRLKEPNLCERAPGVAVNDSGGAATARAGARPVRLYEQSI